MSREGGQVRIGEKLSPQITQMSRRRRNAFNKLKNEFFSGAEKNDKAIDECYFSEELLMLSHPSKRTVVPPQDRDAVEKSPQTNLANSAAEEVKA
jgi:hypothetical protein